MCGTCGCSDGNQTTITGEQGDHVHVLPDGTVVRHSHDHDQEHAHDHEHQHAHAHEGGHRHHAYGPEAHGATAAIRSDTTVEPLEVQILAKNDRLAERNRGWFAGRNVTAVNLMSSPGSGKTTLLERTLREVERPVSVLEGDQETPFDAERIRATGAPVVQINTGKGCHLEAEMIWHGLQTLKPKADSLLFVENVGNLVCPALFDLGEAAKVVVFSTTEGEDKPLKYPHMFRVADLVLINKIDLIPHLDFDEARALEAIAQVNPSARILQVSAKTGAGMKAWYDWLDATSPVLREATA
ncbi:MAG: hydrogenase nickel incorporation protein HypB [Myxococcota bacterium]